MTRTHDVILVTGGHGRLARALQRTGDRRIQCVSRAEMDIADESAVSATLDRTPPALVINAGGFTQVDLAETRQEDAERGNVIGARVVARACAERRVPLIHVSTDLVFGDGGPWSEDDGPAPLSVYGRTKLEGERAVQSAGGASVIVRIAWLFGEQPDFITMMLDLATKRECVSAPADQISSPTPANVLSQRLLDLATRMTSGERLPPILHIAGAPSATRFDWVNAAFEGARGGGPAFATLERSKVADFPALARRPYNSALNADRAATLFGEAIDWRTEARTVGARWARQRISSGG